MTSEQTSLLQQERIHIAAILFRNQQKLEAQMGSTSAEWSRWAITNQWLALEKQRLQILGQKDYREADTANYYAHTFPACTTEPEESAIPYPSAVKKARKKTR